MIAAISMKISKSLLKSNAINQDELNVYAYGIQLLILGIVDWCITFLFMLFDDKYTRKFYQGISLDDMYTYHQANANVGFRKVSGSDVQLSAYSRMCVGTAKTS